VTSSCRSIDRDCRYTAVLEVIEVACCHECFYIGVCKGAVCIPHEEDLVLLLLERLNVCCQVGKHGISWMWGNGIRVSDEMSALLFVSRKGTAPCRLTDPVCCYEGDFLV
jgi:hypothetical protein